jgi:carotenoid cleavage dioxygenase-like enzyme
MQNENHKPYWMKGNFAPVHEEVTRFDLEIEGTIPAELDGLYARNGANPRGGHSGHWFFGDGMLHGVALKNGRAEWYRNRWVRTRPFAGEQRTPENRFDLRYGVANTNIISHAGRIMALVENALPVEISRELDTVGCNDFGGKLKTPFTAHPKRCTSTGELHFFGYSARPPFLTYHVVDCLGVLQRSLDIPVRAPTMMHDFALTAGHVVFMDLPVVFDIGQAMRGTMPFVWSDDYGARLGLLQRDRGIDTLRWVEIEPCYVFHVANAFEEADGTIVMDVARYEQLWRSGPSDTSFESARLRRWRVAPGAARAKEEELDDLTIEFPRVNDNLSGREHRIVYAIETSNDIAGERCDSLVKYNLAKQTITAHLFENGLPSEFVHVSPESGAGEDDGWLMGFVYDRARDASDLLLLDAQNIASKPQARIKLPKRVPQGFHGNWMADRPP